MALFRTVSSSEIPPAIERGGLLLRQPQMSDYNEWASLREKSRSVRANSGRQRLDLRRSGRKNAAFLRAKAGFIARFAPQPAKKLGKMGFFANLRLAKARESSI